MNAGPPPPEPRQIFDYHDGTGVRYADPHVVQRILHARLGGSLAETVRNANGGEKDVEGKPIGPPVPPEVWSIAWEQLYAAAVEAFSLTPFDPATGQGVTETDCAAILARFFRWQADLLKKKRFEIDLAGTYGAAVLSLPYSDQYALWLGLSRVWGQRAASVEKGVRAGSSDEDLSREWYDATNALEECVEDAMVDGNLERSIRRVLSQRPSRR